MFFAERNRRNILRPWVIMHLGINGSIDDYENAYFSERQDVILDPARIVVEVEKRTPLFPDLKAVDEIWLVDASVYQTTVGDDFLAFLRYGHGKW
jgi:hypothetical protein